MTVHFYNMYLVQLPSCYSHLSELLHIMGLDGQCTTYSSTIIVVTMMSAEVCVTSAVMVAMFPVFPFISFWLHSLHSVHVLDTTLSMTISPSEMSTSLISKDLNSQNGNNVIIHLG